jgi:hypothetical protein
MARERFPDVMMHFEVMETMFPNSTCRRGDKMRIKSRYRHLLVSQRRKMKAAGTRKEMNAKVLKADIVTCDRGVAHIDARRSVVEVSRVVALVCRCQAEGVSIAGVCLKVGLAMP